MALMLAAIAKLILSFALVGAALDASETALHSDDECLASDPGAAGCAMSALQLRGVQAPEESDLLEEGGEQEVQEGEESFPEGSENDNLTDSLGSLVETEWWNGWSQGGDKMWGRGTGIESINSGNVHYYNKGMYEAHRKCGGPGCSLIVNPPGHRSKNVFHIHFVHYQSYGASLKQKLEDRVCGRSGWHSGGLPCHGKAAFFPGFHSIFSEAMTGGSIHHASLIAWPMSCGGSGTIVELAYHCSIEHQIRGDYNPHFR